jgi:hypothetical protein
MSWYQLITRVQITLQTCTRVMSWYHIPNLYPSNELISHYKRTWVMSWYYITNLYQSNCDINSLLGYKFVMWYQLITLVQVCNVISTHYSGTFVMWYQLITPCTRVMSWYHIPSLYLSNELISHYKLVPE